MEVLNHVVQTVLNINEAEDVSFHSWMKYMGHCNSLDICIDFQREDIHSYSGYRVEGQQFHHEQTQVVHQLDVNQNEGHQI